MAETASNTAPISDTNGAPAMDSFKGSKVGLTLGDPRRFPDFFSCNAELYPANMFQGFPSFPPTRISMASMTN